MVRGKIPQQDSETGTSGNAPGCNSEAYSLPGILWDACAEEGCGRIYGARLTFSAQDGMLSHGCCDACRPGMYERFGVPFDPGLAVVLLVPWALLSSFIIKVVQHV